MTILDTDEFLNLSKELTQSGKALPLWLEQALLKVKDAEREKVAFDRKLMLNAQERSKPVQERLNSLLDNFDTTLPEEYFKYKNPQLEANFNHTKDNIKQFSNQLKRLSQQAGDNPDIENQVVGITSNLLDRLRNNLGFTPEEKAQLKDKTPEEIAEYYTKTRSNSLDKLNQSINHLTLELNELESHSKGKSQSELVEIYKSKLNDIEKQTDFKRGDLKSHLKDEKYHVHSIHDVNSSSKVVLPNLKKTHSEIAL